MRGSPKSLRCRSYCRTTRDQAAHLLPSWRRSSQAKTGWRADRGLLGLQSPSNARQLPVNCPSNAHQTPAIAGQSPERTAHLTQNLIVLWRQSRGLGADGGGAGLTLNLYRAPHPLLTRNLPPNPNLSRFVASYGGSKRPHTRERVR